MFWRFLVLENVGNLPEIIHVALYSKLNLKN